MSTSISNVIAHVFQGDKRIKIQVLPGGYFISHLVGHKSCFESSFNKLAQGVVRIWNVQYDVSEVIEHTSKPLHVKTTEGQVYQIDGMICHFSSMNSLK